MELIQVMRSVTSTLIVAKPVMSLLANECRVRSCIEYQMFYKISRERQRGVFNLKSIGSTKSGHTSIASTAVGKLEEPVVRSCAPCSGPDALVFLVGGMVQAEQVEESSAVLVLGPGDHLLEPFRPVIHLGGSH
ncbi:hypothetical protein CBL_03827 [Carabus blaptoides fortunei]